MSNNEKPAPWPSCPRCGGAGRFDSSTLGALAPDFRQWERCECGDAFAAGYAAAAAGAEVVVSREKLRAENAEHLLRAALAAAIALSKLLEGGPEAS